MSDSGSGPLGGVRVIDISGSYAGPTASMYLADMGADVIKVERPGTGDDTRSWGPPFIGEESAWFVSVNRGKRGICLDLRSHAGRDVLHRLLRQADVFIESHNPAKLSAYELAPDQLRALYPRLIYCAMSGFGLTGPEWDRPGYDLIAQARSGIMSVTGERGDPQRVSTALSDVVAGMVAAFAIVTALRRQHLTGDGELIDVALLDCDLALMAPRIASYLAGDPEPAPCGATDSVLAVYQRFETKDEWIVIAVGNDAMWQRLCGVLDLADLATDRDLATNDGRRAARDRLIATIEQRLRERPARDWLERLARARVPAAPVLRLSEVVEDPHLHARGSLMSFEHRSNGTVRVVAPPWRLGGQAPGAASPPPHLGAHTIEVLTEAGFDSSEIDRLLQDGTAWSALTTS